MSTLNGKQINNTYQGLIKTNDEAAIDGTLKNLQDGEGNDLPIQVSTGGVNFTGTVTGVPAGPQGPTGPQGDVGAQGNVGPTGADGAQGPTGAAGPQGDVGPQGNVGPQGPAGADGVVQSIVAGTNVTVDATDPANPIVNAAGGGGGGTLPAMDIHQLPPFKGVFLGGASYNAYPQGLTNYTTIQGETASNTQAVLGYIPMAEGDELTSIIFGIYNTSTTTGTLKVGIYATDGTTTSTAGTPYLTAGTLLKDLGTVDPTTTGSKTITFTGVNKFVMPAGQQYGGVWIVIGGSGMDIGCNLDAWSEDIHDGNGGRDLSNTYYRAVSKVITSWDGTFKDYTTGSYTSNTTKPLKLLYAKK